MSILCKESNQQLLRPPTGSPDCAQQQPRFCSSPNTPRVKQPALHARILSPWLADTLLFSTYCYVRVQLYFPSNPKRINQQQSA